ncbi:hypothetical protein HanLR1_Chr03g0105391 [Helianthus annuus]|nr:hypothetical protein HanHA89_Chr03g0112081 [Helianthus annuus]KAJ0768761.1 hypothetical protein HanLR1_Chr03g0105391 [Helianthus annuus]
MNKYFNCFCWLGGFWPAFSSGMQTSFELSLSLKQVFFRSQRNTLLRISTNIKLQISPKR